MDLFTAGGDEDDFPHHVAPFPETSDLLFNPSTALIHSPELITHHHHHHPPPQKLRPIRCNGRSSPVVGELPENGGFVERCQSLTSTDVSYLNDELCVVNGEPSQHLDDLGKQAHASETLRKEDCGHIAGSGGLEVNDPTGYGLGDVKNAWHPNAKGCLLEQESGSSSDDGDDNSSGSTKESGKRTKGRTKKLEAFLENLVMKVMEKQEHMHKQLVDMIEKKEKERIIREEAWKQKEVERIKRDEEARAQEKSRNLALISFIQNLLGNEIQVPQPAVSCLREEDEGEANIEKDFKNDTSNHRWPEAEVQALITLRTSCEHKFRLMGSKGSIWEEISEAMKNMGYNRSAKKCKEKWENINKYYKRTMGSGKKRRLNNKACPYFDELDILYKNGLLNPGNLVSDSNNVPSDSNNVLKIEEE